MLARYSLTWITSTLSAQRNTRVPSESLPVSWMVIFRPMTAAKRYPLGEKEQRPAQARIGWHSIYGEIKSYFLKEYCFQKKFENLYHR